MTESDADRFFPRGKKIATLHWSPSFVAGRLMTRAATCFRGQSRRAEGYTEITSECMVSTVFLGLDHRFFGAGPPILFETMIFGGPESLYESRWRYSSWDDAEAGHRVAVRKAPAALGQKVV